MTPRRVVIGVGNSWRGDDGAGIELARRLADAAPEGLRVSAREGDLAALIEEWGDALDVVVVDAACSGAPPGSIRCFDAALGPLPATTLRSSTHTFGVAQAIELARVLGRLPARLRIYAIEGASFELGAGLSPEVESAVGKLAADLARAG